MKRWIIFYLSAAFLLFLSGCGKSYTYYNQKLNRDLNFNEAELKRVQFYLSDEIVLRRRIGQEESRVADGKVKIIDGSEYEEIVFKEKTPGILLFSPESDRLAVSFEDNGGDKYLMFGPNKGAGGRYVLLAKDWDRRQGKISYDGKTYTTTDRSAYVSLMIDLDKARSLSVKSRQAGGRKL